MGKLLIGWAEESIISLFDKGIVSGKEQGKFYPMDFVKREEFVKMIAVYLGADRLKDFSILFDQLSIYLD